MNEQKIIDMNRKINHCVNSIQNCDCFICIKSINDGSKKLNKLKYDSKT